MLKLKKIIGQRFEDLQHFQTFSPVRPKNTEIGLSLFLFVLTRQVQVTVKQFTRSREFFRDYARAWVTHFADGHP